MEKIIKKQDGITLVALIITIIVMLILAGIVIVSAVADGGIIDRAQLALQEQERAEIEEIEKISRVFRDTASTTLYAYLDMQKTTEALYVNLTENGFKLKAEDGTDLDTQEKFINAQKNAEGEIEIIDLNVQGKHGEYTGTVGDKGLIGEIEIVKEDNNEEIVPPVEEDNEEIVPPVEEEDNEEIVPPVDEDNNEEIDYSTLKVGDIVYYDGTDLIEGKEEWIVYSNDGTNIEIMSNEAIGSLQLGYLDEAAQNLTRDLDGDSDVDDVDKAIYSYNNAVSRIHNYCKEIITAETDKSKVRSPGIEIANDTATLPTTYTYFKNNFKGNFNEIKGEDNYDMLKAKARNSNGNANEYWVASRKTYSGSNYTTFSITYWGPYCYGNPSSCEVWNLTQGYTFKAQAKLKRGVRPIVTNPTDISLIPD